MKLLRGLAALTLALTLASTIAFAQVSPGSSPLSVPKGGTGAATAAGARSSLQVDKFTGHGDSSYSIAASDRVVGTNATLTASRTWTLPAANAVNAGHSLIVADFAGTVTGSNTLVIARAGSDTINGGTSVTINAANGAYLLWSDGTSKWSAQAIGSSIATGVSSIDGATGAISTQAGSLDVTGSTLSSNVLPSRAFAITQDLSAFSAVRTLGYATPGDGGGATFVKVSGVPFKDTYATTGTISGGSGYGANATYNGVRMGGGVGLGCEARVTVSGGAVTAVDIATYYCAAYAVGNALIPNNSDMAGTGSGATFTITAVTTAMASFTDSAGNLWQYVTDTEGVPNVRQFGAKLDWNGTDGTATNDLSSFRSAMAFASVPFSSSAALVHANVVRVPKGAAYLCAGSTPFATLIIPHGVRVVGAGPNVGTTLKQCTAESSNSHFISLCSPFARSGQMGCKLEDISISTTGTSSGGMAAVYSSSGQQYPLINNVYIQPTGRQCIKYETGTGGASNAIFENFDCEVADSTSNASFTGNSSGTQIVIRNAVFGCAPGNCASGRFAIHMASGLFVIDTVHFEQYVEAINVATTSSSHQHSIRNLTINNGCVNGITLANTNPNNTVLIENVQSSCSTWTVLNGHSSGSSVTGNIMAQRVFNP